MGYQSFLYIVELMMHIAESMKNKYNITVGLFKPLSEEVEEQYPEYRVCAYGYA
jgi:hypothetical protein